MNHRECRRPLPAEAAPPPYMLWTTLKRPATEATPTPETSTVELSPRVAAVANRALYPIVDAATEKRDQHLR